MKKVNGHEIIQLFEEWAPKKFAYEGDPIGLHIGDLRRPVTKVLVTLDVDERIVDEAIAQGAELIIAHHPPLFRPVKSIDTSTYQGRVIEKCIKHDIAVYAAHTNLDIAPGGVNDLLAEKLELQQIEILDETYREPLYKLVVFAPVNASEQIRTALNEAGAGHIGEYDSCSYSMEGTGRFRPGEKANPHIGTPGTPEEVREERIEVVVPETKKGRVLKALLKAHPYEEPAFDLIRLEQFARVEGIGRIGRLQQPMTLETFGQHVKEKLDVPRLRFVGPKDARIEKVAVLGGDGNKYIHTAKFRGADVLVTGDMYYHVAQDAERMGLHIVDPGHNVEKVMIEGVARKMSKDAKARGYDVQFIESTIDTEPFTFL